jgi:hypothetical protein
MSTRVQKIRPTAWESARAYLAASDPKATESPRFEACVKELAEVTERYMRLAER